jgi:hypothetical protein
MGGNQQGPASYRLDRYPNFLRGHAEPASCSDLMVPAYGPTPRPSSDSLLAQLVINVENVTRSSASTPVFHHSASATPTKHPDAEAEKEEANSSVGSFFVCRLVSNSREKRVEAAGPEMLSKKVGRK